MVGVPGKSKGCNTCRKRKIACSLERPECSKCVKTKRVCGGYQRAAIFIIDQATGDDNAGLASTSHVKTYRRPIAQSIEKSPVVPGISRKSSSSSSNATTVPFAPDIEITSPAAFRQQFFCQFLSNFVAVVNLETVKLKVASEEGSWLVLVPELPELTKALDTAILALSSVRLGRNNNDSNLIMESKRLYVEGLRDLQNALWDPKLMYRDETLAACMALGMYETLETPGGSRGGWVGHSDGCAKLVQLRGIKANSEGLGHHLYTSFRQTGILQGCHHRKSTYLADPIWTRTASNCPANGSYDQLLDLMVLLPSIFEDADQLGNPTPSEMPALFDILDRCWALDASLQKFFVDLQAANDGLLYWSRLSTLELLPVEVNSERLFPVAFHFKNLSACFTTNMYWMCCILTYRTIMEIYGRIMKFAATHPAPTSIKIEKSEQPQSPPSFMSKLLPLGHRKDLVSIAKNIAQTFEFSTREDKKSQGPGAMMVPLLMATLTFRYSPGCTKELAWARAAMGVLADRGWRIATHLEPEGQDTLRRSPKIDLGERT